MPSMRVAIWVSSSSLFGSFGAGIAVISLSSLIARAVSGDNCWPSKRFDCSIQPLSWVSQRSLALAASNSVSPLM